MLWTMLSFPLQDACHMLTELIPSLSKSLSQLNG